MVEGSGGHVEPVEAPFDPEAGAYAGGHRIIMTMTTIARDATLAAAADLALAGVSDRRFRLLARDRMGGGSGDIPTAIRCASWLADVLAHGVRAQRCDPAAPRASRRAPISTRLRELARRRVRAVARAADGDAGRRAPRSSLRGAAWRAPPSLPARRCLSGRGRRAGRPITASTRTRQLRLSAGVRRQSDLGRGAAGAAWADARTARAGGAGAASSCASPPKTRGATLDDLGGCAFRSDLAAMRHETQYTRLFRS